MKSKSGFTIVEVTLVVVIIGILASITFVAYNKIQQNARDNIRKGNATVISEALEKYYSKKGEYPSVRSLANNYAENTGTVVASKLSIDANVLKMPKMPTGTTNAILSAATPINDYMTYVAVNAIDNNSCQSVLTGGCDSYTLKYITESGITITIESRHKGHPTK